jgi:uncharacterized membrane protein
MTETLAAALLLLLAATGLGIAVYFALLFYRVIPPGDSCGVGSRSCNTAVFSRDGSLLGFPNSLLGIPFYLLVGLAAVGRLAAGRFLLLDLALLASIATVLVGAYLVYSLFAKLKVLCKL